MGAVKGPKRFACRKSDRFHWNRLWVPAAVYAFNSCIPQVWGRIRWNRLWDPIMLSRAKLAFPYSVIPNQVDFLPWAILPKESVAQRLSANYIFVSRVAPQLLGICASNAMCGTRGSFCLSRDTSVSRNNNPKKLVREPTVGPAEAPTPGRQNSRSGRRPRNGGG